MHGIRTRTCECYAAGPRYRDSIRCRLRQHPGRLALPPWDHTDSDPEPPGNSMPAPQPEAERWPRRALRARPSPAATRRPVRVQQGSSAHLRRVRPHKVQLRRAPRFARRLRRSRTSRAPTSRGSIRGIAPLHHPRAAGRDSRHRRTGDRPRPARRAGTDSNRLPSQPEPPAALPLPPSAHPRPGEGHRGGWADRHIHGSQPAVRHPGFAPGSQSPLGS